MRPARDMYPQPVPAPEHVAHRPQLDLDRPYATRALRELMLFQTDRAGLLLESGVPLLGQLTGWARVAVAGYIAGGRAAVHALRRTHGDILSFTARVRRRDVAVSTAELLLRYPSKQGLP